jgi:hypothetical protein
VVNIIVTGVTLTKYFEWAVISAVIGVTGAANIVMCYNSLCKYYTQCFIAMELWNVICLEKHFPYKNRVQYTFTVSRRISFLLRLTAIKADMFYLLENSTVYLYRDVIILSRLFLNILIDFHRYETKCIWPWSKSKSVTSS